MPLNLNEPKTFTLDKVKISKFEVSIKDNSNVVTIHYAIGYENESGEFVTKNFSREDIKNVEFDVNLYESVKTKLYELLDSKVNAVSEPEPDPKLSEPVL